MMGISPRKLTVPILPDSKSNSGKISMIEAHWRWFENRIKNKDSYELKGKKYSVADILYKYLSYTKKDIRSFVTAMPDEIEKMADPNGANYIAFISKKKNLRQEIEKVFKKNKKVEYIKKHPQKPKKVVIKLSHEDNKKIDEETKKMIQYAFGYDDFQNENKSDWNAYIFFEKLKVDVCPYCNCQYTFTIGDVKHKYGKPELDHFYPKAHYPYLSCTLFNFIPSCHQCNNQKRDWYNSHLVSRNFRKTHRKVLFSIGNNSRALISYPYKECFDDDNGFGKEKASFQICLDDQGKIPYKYEKVQIEISNNNPINSIEYIKVNNNVEAFHLIKLYNHHQIALKDLLKRYRNYALPKVKDIINIFRKMGLSFPYSWRQFDFSKDFMIAYSKTFRNQILGLPLGAGDAEYPLRKFKHDIIKQLDDYYKKRIKNS